MCIGFCWQEICGCVFGIKNLGIGHVTGLDLLSVSKKFCIELKNNYNTDNSSSRKNNYSKLAKYKKSHQDYDCIYGVINCRTKQGLDKIISHDGENIRYLSGDKFLTFIFGIEKDTVINLFKSAIEKNI